MCGIKWIVLRNEHYSGTPSDPLEDPVLLSFSRCLEAGLLAVWRRVPRRCLVTYSFDPAGERSERESWWSSFNFVLCCRQPDKAAESGARRQEPTVSVQGALALLVWGETRNSQEPGECRGEVSRHGCNGICIYRSVRS